MNTFLPTGITYSTLGLDARVYYGEVRIGSVYSVPDARGLNAWEIHIFATGERRVSQAKTRDGAIAHLVAVWQSAQKVG